MLNKNCFTPRVEEIMKSKFKALFQNEVLKSLVFLVLGIGFSISINNVTPTNPSIIFFAVSLILLSVLLVILAYERAFMNIRILFLGASITSVLFATHTFVYSIVLNGLIQIPFNALVGLFRSILLASIFSLLERLTRLIEDQLKTRG